MPEKPRLSTLEEVSGNIDLPEEYIFGSLSMLIQTYEDTAPVDWIWPLGEPIRHA